MKTKLTKKGVNKKLLVIGILLVSLIGFIFIVSALSDNEISNLQQELSSLEQNLTNSGYGWLIDYNISYPSVEVYGENSNDLLASFDSLTSNFTKRQIFLTNLSDNESNNVFDLKSMGNVGRIRGDILLKKMRIDKIKEMLKNG
jgi:hypothetical protein